MKSKKCILGLVLIFGALLACGCRAPLAIHGSGGIVTQDRLVDNFNRISLDGSGEVVLTQGEREALSVEADGNLLQYIRTEVKNGTLVLGFSDEARNIHIQPSRPIRFVLCVKEIKALELVGWGSIDAAKLNTDNLEITVSGTGNINIGWFEAKGVEVKISGAGDVELAGQAVAQDIAISGTGQYRAGRLASQRTIADVSGTGMAILWATDNLEVYISGTGGVSYYGTPHVTQKISGLGKLVGMGNP